MEETTSSEATLSIVSKLAATAPAGKKRGRKPKENNPRFESSIKLTKIALISKLARKFNLNPIDMQTIIHASLDMICEALESGKTVEFREFGVFKPVYHIARVGRNPKNPDSTYEIPAHYSIRFKPGKRMRDFCRNGKKA